MDYPREFSQQACARVVAAQLKASQRLEQLKALKPPEEWTKGLRLFDQGAFYSYILSVFLAFAREACKLGDEGLWGVDRISSKADEFLQTVAVEAYYEKGHDRNGQRFPEITDHFTGGLLPEVTQALKDSDEWRQFETDLLAVAKKQVGIAHPTTRAVRTPNMDINDQQKDLLRLLVSKHQSNGGKPFIFVRSHNGNGISYPGGDSVPIACDDLDFHQLSGEGLISFVPFASNQWRGKPTKRGIAAASSGFSVPADGTERTVSTQGSTAPVIPATSPFWADTRAKFERGAEKCAGLSAHWEAGQDLWTFRDDPPGSEARTPAGSECESLFKEAAAIAVRLLGDSRDPYLRALAGTLRQPWNVWLDLMRREKRGFSRIRIVRASQFRAIAEGKRIDLSAAPLSENGAIGQLFKQASDFCVDLEARENQKISIPPADPIAEGFWVSLREDFSQLRKECVFDQNEGPFATWMFEPTPGRWVLHYHRGPDLSGFTKRFEWLAQKAAARLGFSKGGFDAVSFWLDQIVLDAPESLTKPTFSGTGGSRKEYSKDLPDVCYWSAHYCDKCHADEERLQAALRKGGDQESSQSRIHSDGTAGAIAAKFDPQPEPRKRTPLVSGAAPPPTTLGGLGGNPPMHIVRIPNIDDTDTDYPSDFDDRERNKIKAAELRAARVVAGKQSSVRSKADEEALFLRDWVLPIFAAFSKLALNRAKEGTWHGHQVDSESRMFLRLLAASAGLNSPDSWMAGGGRIIRTEIWNKIEHSSEWKRHQEEQLVLIDGPGEVSTETVHKNAAASGEPDLGGRKAAYDQYKRACEDAGVKMTEKKLAKLAHPRWNTRDPIVKWKSGKDRPGDDERIRGVISKGPPAE